MTLGSPIWVCCIPMRLDRPLAPKVGGKRQHTMQGEKGYVFYGMVKKRAEGHSWREARGSSSWAVQAV